MFILLTGPCGYADLGDIWLHDQLARLTQKHVQFGEHYRVDADALLTRAANAARAAKADITTAVARIATGDRLQRATIEAIEHCARQESHVSHAAAAPRRVLSAT
ncbi:hypothetical protein Y036_2864 [Burkholderia pseudomallei]|uniref:Uncharacterized protein n=1 Tax=Burkholderia pseudomallei TaxID=28450 RepID=A0AA40JAN3_BURPE|nr:hypothetical protein Y036_2864 [Burkholderia pseudomallei]